MTDAERFLIALAGDHLPSDERIILCAFIGDPNTAGTHAWRPRPWKPGNEIIINEKANGYATVSSFKRAADGSFRRRTDTFGAGLALMVDDVGTKIKASDWKPEWPHPSAVVETSPNNFQYWYFLKERCADLGLFDGIIRAFIQGALLGSDPGMSGVNRVGRLPGFVNGKEKYKDENGKPFVTRLTEFNPCNRFSTDDLLKGFDLKLNGRIRTERPQFLYTEEAIFRNKQFTRYYKWLREHGMLKDAYPDKSGWSQIRCPWIDEHTNRADTGSAIREPSDENDFWGAFRCHHGHCQDRGWADLTDWITDINVEMIAEANANTLAFEQSKGWTK